MSDDPKAAADDAGSLQAALYDELHALPAVAENDTRFAGERALVAPTTELGRVASIVAARLGEPHKPAGVSAPRELADGPLCTAMGGVRRDQTLYVKALEGGASVYVALWPWGGGARFTIKIGVHG